MDIKSDLFATGLSWCTDWLYLWFSMWMPGPSNVALVQWRIAVYEVLSSLCNIKRVQVDEFSLAHMGCLTMLYYSKLQRPDLVIQFYGDPNQCKQVHERHIEYLNHNHIL